MSDFTAVPRGKVVSRDSFLAEQGCRLSSALWGVTLSGDVATQVLGPIVPASFADMRLVADTSTLRTKPGRAHELTAICEPEGHLQTTATGRVIHAQDLSPRAALRRVISQLHAQGLCATVAPEIEFFLLQPKSSSAQPWQAAQPGAHMAVLERACEANSLERLAHFEPFFDALYAGCDALSIPMVGHDHEAAFSQFEVNFSPADPLSQADAVFRFKSLVKTTAARMGFVACFAPKPFANEPGTGMHWHLSLQYLNASTTQAWPHVFAQADGSDSPALAHFAAGLQSHTEAAMAVFAPHDASYSRVTQSDASATHASFGHEARDLALRIPTSGPSARRLENRLPGGDSNPYLVLATTLGLGAWGMEQQLAACTAPSAAPALPTDLPTATQALAENAPLRQILGETLVDAFVGTLRAEHHARHSHTGGVKDWDYRHLTEGA